MTSELLSLQFWVQDWLAIISLYRPKSIYFFFSPKVRGLFWDNYTQTLNNSLRYPEEPSIVQKKNQGVVNDGVTGLQPQMKAAGLSLVLRLWNQDTSESRAPGTAARFSHTHSYISTMLLGLRQLGSCILTVCKSVSVYTIKHICAST